MLRDLAERDRVELRFILPGKSGPNAYAERFNRTYRTEVPDGDLFEGLAKLGATGHEASRAS